MDALVVINNIQSGFSEGESQHSSLADLVLPDVNADGVVTALDALLILNQLSRLDSGEGELFAANSTPAEQASARMPLQKRLRDDLLFGPEFRDDNVDPARESIDPVTLSDNTLDSDAADMVFGGATSKQQANALNSNQLDDLFRDFGVGNFGEQNQD